MDMSEDPLEAIIMQTINGALATSSRVSCKKLKKITKSLKVENAEEFVYGIVMGVALGMTWCNTECTRKTANRRRSNES